MPGMNRAARPIGSGIAKEPPVRITVGSGAVLVGCPLLGRASGFSGGIPVLGASPATGCVPARRRPDQPASGIPAGGLHIALGVGAVFDRLNDPPGSIADDFPSVFSGHLHA